jgi:hypothetical protein
MQFCVETDRYGKLTVVNRTVAGNFTFSNVAFVGDTDAMMFYIVVILFNGGTEVEKKLESVS